MQFCCSEQLGGAAMVEFFLLEETADWPVVVTDVTAGGITFTPEEHDVDGCIEPESIAINDKPRLGADGNMWPIDIQFVYLTRSAALEQLLEQYANKPGVAIACLNDGSKKLFGTDQEPVYLSWENIYGEKPEDRTGVLVKIKGETRERPVFYTPP